jgi:RNA polymerase-binding transcription factor DksA
MGPDGAPEKVRLNLTEIAADLDAVADALTRLDDGTYWTDEITGAELSDEVLAADPTARSAP